jgi:PAS domain-containing protein
MQYVNDHYLALRKTRREDVIGRRCYDLLNNGRPCKHCAVRMAIKAGALRKITRKDILPDGPTRFIDDYAVPLADENGHY